MRFVGFLSVALGIFTIVFFSVRVIPGDPVDVMLGDNVSTVSRQELRQALHLDTPVPLQFLKSLKDISKLDFGTSIAQKKEVTPILFSAFWNTLILTCVATFFANLLGVSTGVLSVASKNKRFDTLFTVASIWIASFPVFWIGPLLISAFALHWPWFAISGGYGALVLPAITLSLGFAAVLFQTTRAAVLETSANEYMRTAIAKGLSYRRAVFTHALPNAFIPILSVTSAHFGQLLAGALITETVFDWPGIGQLLFQGIAQRDYPVIQGVAFIIAICTLLTNMLTETLIRRRLR